MASVPHHSDHAWAYIRLEEPIYSFHHKAKLRRYQICGPCFCSNSCMTSSEFKKSVCSQNSMSSLRAYVPSRSRNHSYTGTPKPCFLRSISSSGINPRIAFFKIYLSVPFLNLTDVGML